MESNAKHFFWRKGFCACEAAVVLGGKASKAMADQSATVSKERLCRRAGALSEEDIRTVEEAIKIRLDIP